MNVERRRRQLLALINDPGTFEGERDNARRALERLDAAAPPPPQAGRSRAWDPPGPAFEEMLRRFREAAETPEQRARRERWEAESAERQRRWRAEAAVDELERRFREGRS